MVDTCLGQYRAVSVGDLGRSGFVCSVQAHFSFCLFCLEFFGLWAVGPVYFRGLWAFFNEIN